MILNFLMMFGGRSYGRRFPHGGTEITEQGDEGRTAHEQRSTPLKSVAQGGDVTSTLRRWDIVSAIGWAENSLTDPFCHPRLSAVNSSMSARIGDEIAPLDELGKRLREYRMANGVRRTPTAKFFGVSSTTLYFWERGEIIPAEPRRSLLAELLAGRRKIQ